MKPMILVMGGSQGASGINNLVIKSLPLLAKSSSDWQWFHLTGSKDVDECKQAYAKAGIRAVVHPFFNSMDLAMGAATVAISRAGASSLAEVAATRLPSVLVPYPAAVDNHQFHNARAFEQTGAARLMEQGTATPHLFSEYLINIIKDEPSRAAMRHALAQWHFPQAAVQMAEVMLKSIGALQVESAELKPSPQRREEGRSAAVSCHPVVFEPTPLVPIQEATRTT
jgi:UDP-N-acetylglucosamine--N-acetylmuramyl-(pentapeptide) pyrophosphoryl-undecaprenol N-acetylglucosamine transferase